MIEYKGDSEKIIQDLNSLVEFEHNKICSQVDCPTLLIAARGALGDEPLYKEVSYDKTR